MVAIGQLIQVQGELYEVERVLKLKPHVVLSPELTEEMRSYYRVDRIFKKDDLYYLVHEVTTVEPVYD